MQPTEYGNYWHYVNGKPEVWIEKALNYGDGTINSPYSLLKARDVIANLGVGAYTEGEIFVTAIINEAWYNPTTHNFNFNFDDANGAICFELTGALFLDEAANNYYKNNYSELNGKTISFHGYGCKVYGTAKYPSVISYATGGHTYTPIIYAIN